LNNEGGETNVRVKKGRQRAKKRRYKVRTRTKNDVA